MPPTVFYSWQSDNAGVQRHFKKVVEGAAREAGLGYDEATRDEAGAPDIVDTIKRKIRQCAVFVADVSIVHSSPVRHFPNPNVMFEVGFAMSVKSPAGCILILPFGDVDKLP